jgi:transposase
MYTIMQAAKLNEVNPEAPLRDTLRKIADGHPIGRIDELVPWRLGSPITEAARA